MSITIDNSNYINTDPQRSGVYGSASSEQVRNNSGSAYVTSRSAGLAAGSTITGEIVEKDGNEVTIRLGNDQTISAKLQGNANVEVGMKMTFEVAKGAGNQMSLRPLYSNLANNSAAVSALRAANIPVNGTTLAMTDKMMAESMPVNRSALAEMFRNVSAHSNVSPESIVQMTKLNMPLTESNIIQFDNYRNFEHQITNDLQNAANGVADLFKEALGGAAAETPQMFGELTAGEVIKEVLDLVDTESLETIMPDKSSEIQTTEPAQSSQTVQTPEATQTAVSGEAAQTLETLAPEVQAGAGTIKDTVDGIISGLKGIFIPDTGEAVTGADGQTEQAVLVNENLSLTANEQQTLTGQLSDILLLAEQASDIRQPLDPAQIMASVKELVNEYPPENVRVIEAELAAYSEEASESSDDEKLNAAAQNDINSIGTDKAVSTGTAGAEANTAAERTGNVINPEYAAKQLKLKITEKLNELLKSDGFTKLIKDSVKSQMSVRPEEVAQKGKIEELYDRIQKTSARITQLMETIGRSESPAARSAGALSDNVSFMNNLNEFVNYVQLPLKMAGEDANGELYVYTNKKNLANKDGNFSALLHLDMEHLGPMDVYVTMRDYTKVSTNFYLQSEELLDFIESHIDELTKRLTEKGYDTNMKVSQRDPNKPITPITDEFTKEEMHEDAKVIVSKMRFDVRA